MFCSGAGRRTKQADDLILDVAAPRGTFGHVALGLERLTSTMLSDLLPRLADLLEIASYVHCADQFTERDDLSMPEMGAGWRRKFEFHIGVRDPEFWSEPDFRDQLAPTLGFLSDDHFSFHFTEMGRREERQSCLELSADGQTSGFRPDQVMMFSGGLDSFAGAVEAVLKHGKRVALVSHQSSTLVTGFQAKLVRALKHRAGQDKLLHVRVKLTRGSHRPVEFTQRTRSFLFSVLGFLVAHLFGKRDVTFYENGIVSMNLPLAEHVLGTRATRTTHPRVLAELGGLFSRVLASDVRVLNPFFWDTKAEVIRRIADAGCGDFIPSTFSCANVRAANRVGRHCGTCSQCLDRRFGVLAAECATFEPASNYDVDLFRGQRKPGRDTVMAGSYLLAAHRHAGSSEVAFLCEHGEVLRALPYLSPLSVGEAATRLHRLHQRHGQAVRDVVNKQLISEDVLTARLDLPDSSLLAMVIGNQSADIICTDPVERGPTAATLAAHRNIRTVTRPISFAVDQAANSVMFAEGGTLTGSSAKIILELLPNFIAGQQANDGFGGFAFTSASKLAEQFGIGQQALRQRILRTRAAISKSFETKIGAVVENDDVIETNSWQGYRLNPYLAFTRELRVAEAVFDSAG